MKYSLTLALALLMASCYHMGTVGSAKQVRVAEIENRTEEAGLTAMLRQCLAEQFGTRPGNSSKAPHYILSAKIEKITNRSMARAEIREKKSRDDDSDAYQTVLYGLELTVRYQLDKGEGEASGNGSIAGTVIGKASLPRMHDRNVALQDALKQAAFDVAKQIAAIAADAP